jgi:molybdenum cofactor cytidylyltransferase/nicotine blue oxidoreductase
MGVAGAVLAAGSGSRMGAPKAQLVIDGRRLVDRAVGVLVASGCHPVLAVVRPGVDVPDGEVVVNDHPDRGMRSSLELALDAAAARRSAALALLLVDLPGVSTEAVTAVVSAWRPGRIAVADYGGLRGHPIVMSLSLWYEALTRAGPDEGARALVAARPDLVDSVPVVGNPADLDTPDDLARLRRASGIGGPPRVSEGGLEPPDEGHGGPVIAGL